MTRGAPQPEPAMLGRGEVAAGLQGTAQGLKQARLLALAAAADGVRFFLGSGRRRVGIARRWPRRRRRLLRLRLHALLDLDYLRLHRHQRLLIVQCLLLQVL